MASSESYPDDLRYHPEHDWARIDGDEATLGITWYAQDSLGELVHYEPPDVGAAIGKDTAYGEVCDVLPANFGDDLLDKPAAQRQWRWDQQHGLWGYIDPGDTKSWLRHLDYYVKLQQMADESLGTVLGALEETGAYDETIVIFTSDHGDMCGSHGLRSKGPFVYEEIMHVPCYVRVPGLTRAGSQSDALATHVDLASTICALGGVDPGTQPSLKGVDLTPVLAEPSASVRDHVLFAHDTAHTDEINHGPAQMFLQWHDVRVEAAKQEAPVGLEARNLSEIVRTVPIE